MGKITKASKPAISKDYDSVLTDVVQILEEGRRTAARAVNKVMTATYWLIGKRIIEEEQQGKKRAGYGEELIGKLSADLTKQFGRGFSHRNLRQMRLFYSSWPIRQALPAKFKTPISPDFSLPWTHYVILLSIDNQKARAFYEAEALRGGWSSRQLERQVNTQFYERTLMSKNKTAMLTKGSKQKPEDFVSAEEEIKDPFFLEFLGLKDEYSESELESALISQLEDFLLELGNDFAFIGRQRKLRVGDAWYKIDLLFFHRRLKCLVIIDLKIGKFTHADAGQINLYLNYARKHWMVEGENPPVGLVLCTKKDDAVVHYSLDGSLNKVLAAEYRTALPNEAVLEEQVRKTMKLIEGRKKPAPKKKTSKK